VDLKFINLAHFSSHFFPVQNPYPLLDIKPILYSEVGKLFCKKKRVGKLFKYGKDAKKKDA